MPHLTDSNRPRYFTAEEIRKHNDINDCWVSLNGDVFDLTPLVQKLKHDVLVRPILYAAGNDISHWFKGSQVRTRHDPESGLEVPYTPQGKFLHCPEVKPTTAGKSNVEIPWWQDETYKVGRVGQKTRKLRIYNSLDASEIKITVCAEETLNEIKERYMREFNTRADGYNWKFTGISLDMNKTLEENNIPDVAEHMEQVGIDEDEWIPVIHLYFNDDLK